jgi:hypothetical protein
LEKGLGDVLEGGRGAAGKPADPGHDRLLGIGEERTEAGHQQENEHCCYEAHDVISSSPARERMGGALEIRRGGRKKRR